MNTPLSALRALVPSPLRSTLAAVLVAALPLASCVIIVDGDGEATMYGLGRHSGQRGSGVLLEDTRTLGSFDGVHSVGSVDVVVVPGDACGVTVSGDDNLVDRVRTEVRDGVLEVSLRSGSYSPRHDLVVRATVPGLRSVALEGSGSIDFTAASEAALSVNLLGSGDVVGRGRSGALSVELEGSGDIDLVRLAAPSVAVHVLGSGDASVHCDGPLTTGFEGSGAIVYCGMPTSLSTTALGNGSVRARACRH